MFKQQRNMQLLWRNRQGSHRRTEDSQEPVLPVAI
jgi:hypothetical protein